MEKRLNGALGGGSGSSAAAVASGDGAGVPPPVGAKCNTYCVSPPNDIV